MIAPRIPSTNVESTEMSSASLLVSSKSSPAITNPIAARFLSDEDLDLANLSDAEFDRLSAIAWRAMQATNTQDAVIYRHGCFVVEPGHEHLMPLIRSGAI